jgi:DNA replication and repair protein RecF
MALAELTVQDLRCIETTELTFGPGTTLVYGANGAGKTSILEAIYVLGRGRSFRTRLNERLIRHGQGLCRVVGRVAHPLGTHSLGVEVRKGSDQRSATAGRLNGNPIRSLSELALAFPTQIIDPDAHKLIEESATRRRRWLDWAVFHVEPGFASAWSRYQRALLQRNAALKSGSAPVAIWDEELAREGETLTSARERVLTALLPYWSEMVEELVGLEVSLGFSPGWDRSASLSDALIAHTSRDRDRRTTTVGPHRADISVRVKGRAAREVLSRGQQKLAAVTLNLCQLEFLKQEHDLRPTVLLDDPSAELDHSRLARFIGRVRRLDTQIVVTALEKDFRLFGEPENLFHVEQGRVFRV